MSDGPKLLLATHNKGKLREFASLLAGVQVVGLAELGLGDLDEPFDTFVDNAAAKARAASARTGLAALADDSGLCVDALDGAPGVYSARFAGTHGDDAANRRPHRGDGTLRGQDHPQPPRRRGLRLRRAL